MNATIIRLHLKPLLGAIRLQALRSIDIEDYFARKAALSQATLEQHHHILHGALEAAARSRLVTERREAGE